MKKLIGFIGFIYSSTFGKLEIHLRVSAIIALSLIGLNILFSMYKGTLFGSRDITSEWKLNNTIDHLRRFRSYHEPEPTINWDGTLVSISTFKIDVSNFKLNLDEKVIKDKFDSTKSLSDSLAIIYIDEVNSNISTIESKIKFIEDSLNKIREKQKEKIAIKELQKYYKTKAGRINKKHKDWSTEDCEKLANRRIWIGMHIEMVKYLRGLPNHVNTSNYGYGNQYQMCWDDYNPSCFYCESDGIVTSYN